MLHHEDNVAKSMKQATAIIEIRKCQHNVAFISLVIEAKKSKR